MSERSCSIPLVVRLRGMPDEARLAEMSETIARSIADRLAEAAGVIAGLEGWTSYRETRATPAIRFSGGSLDTNAQQRVAAAIEAGFARAVASTSGAVASLAQQSQLTPPQSPAAPTAVPPRLDPRETEAGWSLNGISVFRVQRPDGEAESSRLNFYPLLSTNSDGSTKLVITVFRDPNVIVLLQPDAISQLSRLGSEIEIRDILTVAAREDRPAALDAAPSIEASPSPAISESASAPPSAPTRQDLEQAIVVPAPAPSAAIGDPQFVASPPASSPGYGSWDSEGVSPPLGREEAADVRATEQPVFNEQSEGSASLRVNSGIDPATTLQSPNAPSTSEGHYLPRAGRHDSIQPLAGAPADRRAAEKPFDRISPEGVVGEPQQVGQVIVLQSRTLLTEEEFAAGVERARGPNGMIFPYKKARSAGSEASPIHAARLPAGRVWVHLREDIFATVYAADRDLRLPPVIGKGIELDESDVVGVKFIDEGVLRFVPAVLLMHLENDATRAALTKTGEALAGGPTMQAHLQPAMAQTENALPTERHGGAAGPTSLALADPISIDSARAGSVIREHRDWIIATSSDAGAALIGVIEQLCAASDELARGVSPLFEFADDLEKCYQDWRATIDVLSSPPNQDAVEKIEQIEKNIEELLRTLKKAAPSYLGNIQDRN